MKRRFKQEIIVIVAGAVFLFGAIMQEQNKPRYFNVEKSADTLKEIREQLKVQYIQQDSQLAGYIKFLEGIGSDSLLVKDPDLLRLLSR